MNCSVVYGILYIRGGDVDVGEPVPVGHGNVTSLSPSLSLSHSLCDGILVDTRCRNNVIIRTRTGHPYEGC